MYSDPTGEFVISSFLIALAITTVAITATGAVVGGISAAIKNEDVSTGIGNGALVGILLSFSVWLTSIGLYNPIKNSFMGRSLMGGGIGSAFSLSNELASSITKWRIREFGYRWLIKFLG